MTEPECRRIRRWLRTFRFGVHVLEALLTIALVFPFMENARRKQRIQHWSKRLMRLLGIEVRVFGDRIANSGAVMTLSNHVSWLDIFALNSIEAARFVAKSEVAGWPLIGRLCKGTGTIFAQRNNKRDAARVNHELVMALQKGEHVAMFPEGTSTDGLSLKAFRSPLLQSAIDTEAVIQPAYLRYANMNGTPSRLAAYCDDISFGESLVKILGSRGLCIEIHYLDAVMAQCADDRRMLMRSIEQQIRHRHDSFNRRMSGSSDVR